MPASLNWSWPATLDGRVFIRSPNLQHTELPAGKMGEPRLIKLTLEDGSTIQAVYYSTYLKIDQQRVAII